MLGSEYEIGSSGVMLGCPGKVDKFKTEGKNFKGILNVG